MKKVLDTELTANIVRYELAVFGLENILIMNNSDELQRVKKLLSKTYKLARKIENEFEQEFEDLDKFVPLSYTDMNHSLNPEDDNFKD